VFSLSAIFVFVSRSHRQVDQWTIHSGARVPLPPRILKVTLASFHFISFLSFFLLLLFSLLASIDLKTKLSMFE
jgi:hypothetical protein